MAAKKKKPVPKKVPTTKSAKTAPKKAKVVKKRAPAMTSPATRRRTPAPGAGEDGADGQVSAYQHEETRKNNPPAGLVEFDRPLPKKKKDYSYDPHLDPQLQWAGKAEHTSFEVDTVSLHIHERISTQAILRAVRREDAPAPGQPQLNLFAKPDLPPAKEVDFYGHDVGWANRLVLGDSLTVMNSLLEREHMGGQVQCIFMDPPYGVKFNSNFQAKVSDSSTSPDSDETLTREPEQVQAYRDTWELGVHSYLTYLRDRLLLCRQLLSETGSIFIQISNDHVHRVRNILDEVMGPNNFISEIVFLKTTSQSSKFVPTTNDFVLWYAKDRTVAKFRPLYREKRPGDEGAQEYTNVELADGTVRPLTQEEIDSPSRLPLGARIFTTGDITSDGYIKGSSEDIKVDHNGVSFTLSCEGRLHWKVGTEGTKRLWRVGRLLRRSGRRIYKRYLDEMPGTELSNIWTDTRGETDKRYVVQTSTTPIERCILMTSDPGDLVLDPTCGSGSTAYASERWGRRWVTCDTSRVALSIARSRMMTSSFPYFETRSSRIRDGFIYKRVPHVLMSKIAHNEKLDQLNTRADIEREIRVAADGQDLLDQPQIESQRVRVSGPFTVEAIPLPSMEDLSRDIDGEASKGAAVPGGFSQEVNQYLTMLMDVLRQTGVNFPGNKRLRFPTLRAVKGAYEWFHAEGTSDIEGDPRSFAVSFGPRHGPVSTTQVLEAMREARGKDVLLFCGFACDPEARKIIDQGIHGTSLVFAHAAPDILVGDLLKKKKTDQLFAVFGAPDVKAHTEDDGRVSVEVLGIDLYDPISGSTNSATGASAAAIFVDHDYDGKTFCVSQALFPGGGSNAWEKLQKALRGSIDEDKFAALRTTRSLPFKPGLKVAVKVVDDRGNEVIKLVDARKALKK